MRANAAMPCAAWVVCACALWPAGAARAADAGAGRAVAYNVCGWCHVVGLHQQIGPALRDPGPSFRAIANRPRVSAGSLRHFIESTHPVSAAPHEMPNPQLTDDQLDDVVAYILSLRGKPKPE